LNAAENTGKLSCISFATIKKNHLFGLTILGNNSAIPAFDRHPTAQVLTYDNQVFLIDCGEGTQLQMNRYKIKRSKINHIFISHLHGDHYFGLIGFITSMGLMGRTDTLYIYGVPMLMRIITMQLEAASSQLKFPIQFVPLTHQAIILDNPKIEVTCFPVKHRVDCFGFLFREKKNPRKLIIEQVLSHQIPTYFFGNLQMGENYLSEDGTIISNSLLTTANQKGLTYAYSADTIYDESLCDIFRNVDLLYHESTYLNDMYDRAASRFHSTALQAAKIAKIAGVKRLLLGHFSSKYENLSVFLNEASTIFEPVEIAQEGVTFRIF
jgi:ribonuclease Z